MNYKYKQRCTCKYNEPIYKVFNDSDLILEDNFIWERFYKIGGQFCQKCRKLIGLKFKYLIGEITYYNDLIDEFDIENIENKLKKLLNKFIKQESVQYKTFIINLKEGYNEIINSLWKSGLIRIHRKKISPKLSTPIELANSITRNIKNQITRQGLKNIKISLSEKGRDFLQEKLEWDIDSQITESLQKFQILISEKMKIIGQEGLNKSKDIRIKKIVDILKFYKLENGRKVRLGNFSFDLITKYSDLITIINLLIFIILKISKKKLVSIKEFSNKKILLPNKGRTILKKVLNCDLILFNIFPEVFGKTKKPEVIFKELQQYSLNYFEPELKSFIIAQLKNNIQLDRIWNNNIPSSVKKNVRNIYINSGTKYSNKTRNILNNEFTNLINNSNIDELLSYTYFGDAVKIIAFSLNWNTIFKKYYPNFSNPNECFNKFKSINMLRNKLAHKSNKKFNILNYIKKYNLNLSDILEDYYNYVIPLT